MVNTHLNFFSKTSFDFFRTTDVDYSSQGPKEFMPPECNLLQNYENP